MPYKKIVFFAVVLILLLTINDLARSLYSIWQKQDLIVQAQRDLTVEKQENQNLKKQINQVNQPEFIETEARDNLLLAKSGEGIVIIPTDKLPKTTPPPNVVDARPNWLKWLQLFFNS